MVGLIRRVKGTLLEFRRELVVQAVGCCMIVAWAIWMHYSHFEDWSNESRVPIPGGWQFSVPLGVLVLAAIASVLLSVTYPILGCLAFFLVHRATDRYGGDGVWLLRSGMVYGIAILNCSGWLLWRHHRKVPLGQLLRRPIFWLAIAWIFWIGAIELVARIERPEQVPFLLRNWALAMGAVLCLVIALDTVRTVKDLAFIAFGSVIVIAYRAMVVQEDLWLDGEMALMAVTTMPLLAAVLALDSWMIALPIGVLCCAFLAWTLVRTHNRGGYVGLVAAIAATPLAFPWRLAMPIALGGIALAGGILYAYPGYLRRFTEIQTGGRNAGSVQSRLEIYESILSHFPQNRWFGLGIGRTGYLVEKNLPEVGHMNAHNTWLANLIESGIPGAMLFNLILLAGLFHALRLAWSTGHHRKVVGGAVLCFLAAYCGVGLGHARDLYEVFYLMVGLAAAFPGGRSQNGVDSGQQHPIVEDKAGVEIAPGGERSDQDQMSRSSIR
jgi:O-antigen ligase